MKKQKSGEKKYQYFFKIIQYFGLYKKFTYMFVLHDIRLFSIKIISLG